MGHRSECEGDRQSRPGQYPPHLHTQTEREREKLIPTQHGWGGGGGDRIMFGLLKESTTTQHSCRSPSPNEKMSSKGKKLMKTNDFCGYFPVPCVTCNLENKTNVQTTQEALSPLQEMTFCKILGSAGASGEM